MWNLEDELHEVESELRTTKDKLKVAERALRLALVGCKCAKIEPLTRIETYTQLAINQLIEEEKRANE